MIHSRGESFDPHDGPAAIAVAPDSDAVTIPDAHFLFTADFTRKGPDLVLTGEDGHKVLVPDYFRHEKHLDLRSPEGALLSANMVELLSAGPAQYAQDGPPVAQQPVGRVETVTGSATVVRNGVAVDLNVGDLVFQGDVVQTGTNSALAIAFSDGSAFTLNDNARMALNEFVYDPNGTSNSALINIVQGTVTFIAAQVAKTGNMRVETPTAALGIRGTFITLSVSATDGHTVASLGLETDQATGQQFSGAFTLTNRITGNQVTVSDVASMFSVSPTGTMSESPKPPAIAAIEQAAFQALVPVMAAAANFGAATNQGNPTQTPDQNAHQPPNPSSNPSPGPAPGGSPGANPGPQNASPDDNHPTTVPLTSTPPPSNTPPPNSSAPPTTSPTQNPVLTPITDSSHITPTATVANIAEIETATAQSGSFNIFALVSVANAGSPTGYVNGSATLVSASVPGGLPAALTNANFLGSLVTIDADGTVHYDLSKFNFLGAGQSLSYSIAFDVKSGTDTLHLALTFTVNGANEAPSITIGAGDAAAAIIRDDTHATTLSAVGTLSFKDADATDGHVVSVTEKSGHVVGLFRA